jgi:hypothetical protein
LSDFDGVQGNLLTLDLVSRYPRGEGGNEEEILGGAIFILSILAVVVVIVGFFGGFFTALLSGQGRGWVSVAVWNGSQEDCNMTTEQFVIEREEWRINWQSTLSSDSLTEHFHLIVYDAYTGSIAKELSPTSPNGESYLNAKGTFSVKIFIVGDLGDWRVGAEEYR